jgi:hypothetical protein
MRLCVCKRHVFRMWSLRQPVRGISRYFLMEVDGGEGELHTIVVLKVFIYEKD